MKRFRPKVLIASQYNLKEYFEKRNLELLPHVVYDQVLDIKEYQSLEDKYKYDSVIVYAKESKFVQDVLND
jgi:hypothetical protein